MASRSSGSGDALPDVRLTPRLQQPVALEPRETMRGYCTLCRRSPGAPLSRGFQANNGDFLCIVCGQLEKLATSSRSKTRSLGPVARQIAAGKVLSARMALNM